MANPLVLAATYNKRPLRMLGENVIDADKLTRELGLIEGALKYATSLAGTVFNVLDFGADPRGVGDSTAAIQRAVDAADGGDVLFPSGTFRTTAAITVAASCTLRFVGATIHCEATRGFTVTANKVSFLLDADSDIYLDIAAGEEGQAIHAAGVDVNNLISDFVVRGGWFHSNGASGNAATFEHNAISTRFAERVWIQGVRFSKFDGEMIYNRDEFDGSTVTQHWDLWILDNFFEDGGFEAINPWAAERVVIAGNIMRDLRQGIEFQGRDAVIANNVCEGMTDATLAGIFVANANDYRVRNVAVSDNVCKDGAGYGITLSRGMSGVTVDGNICTANAKDGLWIKNLDLFAVHIPEEIIVRGNVFKGNTSRGVYLNDTNAVSFFGPNDVLIEGNIFIEDTVQTIGIRVDASCANIRIGINHYVDVTTPHSFATGAGVEVFDPGVTSDVLQEFNVFGAAGTNRDVSWWSGTRASGSRRWTWRTSSDAESGSDAGSSFGLVARTDAGAFIDNVWTFLRAAGGYVALAAGRPFSMGGTPGGATTATRRVKAVTGIADGAATAVLTITVPNAAHSGTVRVCLVGSLGAGGAIGANEASASISYDIAITRTAGVNAVAAISAAYGSSGSAAVAGADTCTVTAAVSAVSGAVGATNTFTVNVTVARGGGASTNHTCQVLGEIVNANASGISIT